MTFKERMNLLLHRSECIRVILYDDTKRVTQNIVRYKRGAKSIEINEKQYLIDVNNIYFLEGLPTLTYHITSANGMELLDPTRFKSPIDSADQLNDIYHDKTVSELHVNASEQKMTIQNMLVIMGIGIVGVLGIALFIVYNQVKDINEYIEANKDVIELIKDYLLRNGG